MCRDCGYTLKCKRCNISLTYHEYTNTLKCHYCGYEINNVTTCPSCKSKNIKFFGTGTEKLENEIKKLFPQATTIRMDVDTVTKKNSHETILNKFKNCLKFFFDIELQLLEMCKIDENIEIVNIIRNNLL